MKKFITIFFVALFSLLGLGLLINHWLLEYVSMPVFPLKIYGLIGGIIGLLVASLNFIYSKLVKKK